MSTICQYVHRLELRKFFLNFVLCIFFLLLLFEYTYVVSLQLL